MKLSFKKEKPTDFDTTKRITIKADGKKCGMIYITHERAQIQLAIEKTEKYDDGNPNCKWMNVSFASIQGGEMAGREWVKANWEKLCAKFTLHLLG
jgi:hypothetical protein